MEKEKNITEPTYSYDITGLESEVVKFEFLKEDLIDKSVGAFTFRTASDIEKAGESHFIYYQDFRLEAERAFYIYLRSVFDMEIEEENVYKFDTQRALILSTFDSVKEAIRMMHEKENKKYDPSVYEQPDDEFWNHYIRSIDHSGNCEALRANIENNLYDDYYTFEQTYGSSILADGTRAIIDELFFNNLAFNHRKNYETLNQVIPINFYLSLRRKILMLPQGNVAINFHKFIYFIICVDCACYLLTSDWFDLIEERLDKGGMDHKVRMDYLKIAQDFVHDSKKNIKKGGVTIGNWEEQYDWSNLIY